ncbi:hypothetical protein [Cellulomonas rhizosphaerae]|uniref:Phage portal protein n=1 Tax=Cellulomonas rhizosphaerae TaxID=2293719 RepID=A0A413RJH4_9CELL|nr:hypothetical protein [Cellulomonas rhizosphaerae]RHA38730.1 hypothetical protein D1825_13430 [Cellulomonas rhizosphaerae]
MGLFTRKRDTAIAEASSRAYAAEASVEILQEGMADLELMLEDQGWERLVGGADREFSRAGLTRAAKVARVLAIQHPLIKRGLALRHSYVWGQGVEIAARADGNNGAQDVNAVITAFMDDPGNKAALTGAQAREELERALGTDGNVCLACFTNPRTGFVQVRSILFDEITDVICNPDDRDDPWFYRRQWVQETIDPATAYRTTTQMVAYYPAVGYRPRSRYKTIDGHPVVWDAPMIHGSVNRLDGWKFGIGDAYAAITWARLYRDFLIDWATLVKALSQFAWRGSRKGSKAQRAREALTRRPTTPAPAANPNNVGATVLLDEGQNLEAIPKSGATIDSESGRPLAAMVAAALGVPVTMLLADPGTTGNRATAETLDRPTSMEMNGRRSFWTSLLDRVHEHVIREAVRAPQGPLKGSLPRDPVTGRESLVLAQDTDATVEITWPAIDDVDMDTLVKAIVAADGTGKLPPEETVKLLLRALGVKDIDELLEEFFDDDGHWVDPLASAGQAAVDAFRRGQDPAALVGAGGEDDPEPPPEDNEA